VREHRLPAGSELAWELHSRLSGAAVQLHGLQALALETIDLELDQFQARRLLDQMNAIVEGFNEAGKELKKAGKQ